MVGLSKTEEGIRGRGQEAHENRKNEISLKKMELDVEEQQVEIEAKKVQLAIEARKADLGASDVADRGRERVLRTE